MENDQGFVVDADLDAVSRSRSRHSHGDRHRDQVAATASTGATEAVNDDPYEDTPLLSRTIEEDLATRPSSPGSVPHYGEPEWSGASDFEGKSWWNKPSVR